MSNCSAPEFSTRTPTHASSNLEQFASLFPPAQDHARSANLGQAIDEHDERLRVASARLGNDRARGIEYNNPAGADMIVNC